jgi:RNA-dependent RNA polymerase
MINNIKKGRFCFSDGIGKISQLLAKLVVIELGLEVFNTPSAFQFRLGGCKGILAVWPDAKKSNIYIRNSQINFQSNSTGLEIIRYARFVTATPR